MGESNTGAKPISILQQPGSLTSCRGCHTHYQHLTTVADACCCASSSPPPHTAVFHFQIVLPFTRWRQIHAAAAASKHRPLQCSLRHSTGLHGVIGTRLVCHAGNKVVEYTDRTAAEVDEMIKERQERNKVLREP